MKFKPSSCASYFKQNKFLLSFFYKLSLSLGREKTEVGQRDSTLLGKAEFKQSYSTCQVSIHAEAPQPESQRDTWHLPA